MEFTIRKPKATDIFVVGKIIKKIGLKNIAKCFEDEELAELRKSFNSDNDNDNNQDELVSKAGMLVVLSIGDLVLEKLEDVQDDVFKFMSNLTGLKVKEVEDLSPSDFYKAFMTIVKEPDFLDFIKVVLKSFN